MLREAEAARFLSAILPTAMEILQTGEPSFRKDSPEHIFRHALLDTIHRLPLNEFLKPHAPKIMALMLHLVRVDNEENGVTCIKVVIDLNRSYRMSSEEHLSQFIDFVQDLYKNTKSLVNEYFAANAATVDPLTLSSSIRSFKVLTECPIATVLLFQSHRNAVNPAIRTMIPLVVDVRTRHFTVQS